MISSLLSLNVIIIIHCLNEINDYYDRTIIMIRLIEKSAITPINKVAYYQYTAIPQDYPWYIEADAEGAASYIRINARWIRITSCIINMSMILMTTMVNQ
jgi:hypothetical protein